MFIQFSVEIPHVAACFDVIFNFFEYLTVMKDWTFHQFGTF